MRIKLTLKIKGKEDLGKKILGWSANPSSGDVLDVFGNSDTLKIIFTSAPEYIKFRRFVRHMMKHNPDLEKKYKDTWVTVRTMPKDGSQHMTVRDYICSKHESSLFSETRTFEYAGELYKVTGTIHSDAYNYTPGKIKSRLLFEFKCLNVRSGFNTSGYITHTRNINLSESLAFVYYSPPLKDGKRCSHLLTTGIQDQSISDLEMLCKLPKLDKQRDLTISRDIIHGLTRRLKKLDESGFYIKTGLHQGYCLQKMVDQMREVILDAVLYMKENKKPTP